MTFDYAGACHCGNIRFVLHSLVPPDALEARVCDCTFCEKHGARYVSDPEGRLSIQSASADFLVYRQGSGTARFMLCGNCGLLVGAFHAEAGRVRGAVNARCIDEGPTLRRMRASSVQNIGAEEKRLRWLELWTPVSFAHAARLA